MYSIIQYAQRYLTIGRTVKLYPQSISGRCIHTTVKCSSFWEYDKKSSYKTKLPKTPLKQMLSDGFQEFKTEFKLWKEEIKDHVMDDRYIIYRQGEVDVVFNFKDENSLDKWIVTADSDHNEGKSTAFLEINNSGAGVFHGSVNSEHVKDGVVKRTGYANIRTKRIRKSFKRESTYNWTPYNLLVMKIRGDGRSYLLNLHTEGYFDITWNDVYHYALYTRGGPHWQITKIPFSKFFYSSKGRIQDKQEPIKLDRITHFGLSVSAKNGMDGPFNLEIDYIGLEFDPRHTEEFAYEFYRTPKYITAS